jgi:hypothetical protein
MVASHTAIIVKCSLLEPVRWKFLLDVFRASFSEPDGRKLAGLGSKTFALLPIAHSKLRKSSEILR